MRRAFRHMRLPERRVTHTRTRRDVLALADRTVPLSSPAAIRTAHTRLRQRTPATLHAALCGRAWRRVRVRAGAGAGAGRTRVRVRAGRRVRGPPDRSAGP